MSAKKLPPRISYNEAGKNNVVKRDQLAERIAKATKPKQT